MNLSASAGDARDAVTGLGKSPGGEHGNLLQYPTQRVSWIEEPGRLGSIATHRVRYD